MIPSIIQAPESVILCNSIGSHQMCNSIGSHQIWNHSKVFKYFFSNIWALQNQKYLYLNTPTKCLILTIFSNTLKYFLKLFQVFIEYLSANMINCWNQFSYLFNVSGLEVLKFDPILWPMQTVNNKWLFVSSRPGNSIYRDRINDQTILRAFVIFLILVYFFAFLLDGNSLHSIIGGCKAKPSQA